MQHIGHAAIHKSSEVSHIYHNPVKASMVELLEGCQGQPCEH